MTVKFRKLITVSNSIEDSLISVLGSYAYTLKEGWKAISVQNYLWARTMPTRIMYVLVQGRGHRLG